MNTLEDFKEEIYKCSRCGLCQSVCPVFKVAHNECAVSRGKFNMLNGIIKNELTCNKKIKSYLDLCTGCNACKDFCPSNIDAKAVFRAAKYKYYQENSVSFWEKLFNSYFLFKSLLVFSNISFFVYRLFFIDKIVSVFEPMILKCGLLGKRFVLMNKLVQKQYDKTCRFSNKNKAKKAVYFKGCFNKYLNSETENAVKTILLNSDIELVEKDFECCGISYYNDGNIDYFKKLINKNIDKFEGDFDYILTDCASCLEVLKSYKLFTDSPKAQKVSDNVLSVTDLIKTMDFKTNLDLKVAVHKPCHDSYDFVDIVKNIKGINFVDAIDFDKCCGFSGKFALQNSEISREISVKKVQHYLNVDTDIILTTCPACVLGLNQGLAELQTVSKPKVMNLFVFLAMYCKN